MLIHTYRFDPTYGYGLEDLMRVAPPEEVRGFARFWRDAYEEALKTAPRPQLRDSGEDRGGWRVFDLTYQSTGDFRIGGWLLLPVDGIVRRGFVIGHGYGGRDAPDFGLPFADAALLFPCCRGLSRSRRPPISPDSGWHVLHDIDKKDRYIHRGCVEDTWLAVSALLRLFPQVGGHIGYLGTSFGGGIGALALAWDGRVSRAHLNVPSFGHHPLRSELSTLGSAASIQEFRRRFGETVMETLGYYDAAVAARYIRIPVHCACALFDPFVAPPGQFAIYNALSGPKKLFALEAGHHEYPRREFQERQLKSVLMDFFSNI